MGMPQDNFPKGDITPLPNPEIDPALLEGMPESEVQKSSKIKLGEQLVDPTATAAPETSQEALKDPTKQLAEISSQVGAGSVTPEALKIDTQAMRNFGVNDKTVPQGGQPSVAAPQPQKSPSLDTGAMENFGVNERTLNPITQPEAPTAFQPQEALATDSEGRGADWLAAHETDLGGKSLRESVPASPFAGQEQQRVNLDIPNPLMDIVDPSTGNPPAVPASQSMGTPAGTPPAVPTSPTGLDTSSTGNFGVNDRTAPPQAPWDPAKRVQDSFGLTGDTSNIKDLKFTTQGQWKDQDPVAVLEQQNAYETMKNQGRLGVDSIESQLGRMDKSRYDRASQLAEARGVALDQYMQGLNRNERKSFVDTIIRSLGKILVGGYDLMSGPKTAAASQYYKDPEAYDKKGADALEMQKYGEKIKSAEATEKDISSVETASIENKKMLEDLRGKINNDVFRMANDLVKSTELLMNSGVDRSHITAGWLQMLKDKENAEYALEKMKAEHRLQQSIQDGITRSANAKTMAESNARKQAVSTEDNKKVERKLPVEAVDKAVNTLTSGESKIVFLFKKGEYRTNAGQQKALAESNKYFEAFKANPTPENREAYRASIARYHGAIREALTHGVFLDQEPKNRAAMNSQLDEALNLYYGASARDESHPFYTDGPEKGLLKMSAYAQAQREEAIAGRPSYIITVGNDTTEGTSNKESKEVTQTKRTQTKGDNAAPAEAPAQGPGTPMVTPDAGTVTPMVTPTQGSGTPAGTPTPAKTAVAPSPKPTVAKPAVVLPAAEQKPATPAKPLDAKLQNRLRELKQVTKKGLLTPEQRAEVSRYLADPAVKRLWDTLSVPSAPAARPTQGPTPAAQGTAKPAAPAQDIRARLLELQAKMKAKTATPAEIKEAKDLIVKYDKK
jgi:hypothetical protein